MLTDIEKQVIKDNFGKKTLPQIKLMIPNANKYTYSGFRCICQRMGLFRNKSIIRLPTKNLHDECYWDFPHLINSYLAGIIGSDGCILKLKNGYSFSIKLAVKDECLIDLFIKELKLNGKKSYCSNKSPHSDNISHQCYISISCFDKNAENLKKYYNLLPHKTERLGPTNLNDKFLNFSYIIGLWDGDGTISYRINYENNDYNTIYMTICSASPHIIRWTKNIFDENFPAEKFSVYGRIAEVGYHNQDHFYRYNISGLRAAVVINYLSKFQVPKLERKWNNPLVWEYINIQKSKYPHLFIEPDQSELAKYLPENISQNTKNAVI